MDRIEERGPVDAEAGLLHHSSAALPRGACAQPQSHSGTERSQQRALKGRTFHR